MIAQQLQMLISHKKGKDFLIYGLGQGFNLLSPLLVVPYIVSVCGEDGLGKMGLGFALALFLILIVDYGFDIKGTKIVAENRKDQVALQKILSTTIFTKSILFVVAFTIAIGLIGLVPFFNQEKELFFFSLLIVFAQVFNPVWFLQGIEKFAFASILNIGSKTMYVLLIYFGIVYKTDYTLANVFLGFSSLVFNIAGLLFIWTKFNFKIVKPHLQDIKTILKTDFSFCLSQLFLSARQLSPLVITSYFLGFYIAGQYKIIEQIITLIRTFIQVYLKFFYPSVCYKMLADSMVGFAFWKKYTVVQIKIVLSMLLLFFLFSVEILQFFNVSPATVLQLNFVFRVSLLISILMAFSLPMEQLMFLVNKHKIYIRIAIAVTIINVFLILLLVRRYEVLGVVVSLIVSELFFIGLYFRNSYLNLKHK